MAAGPEPRHPDLTGAGGRARSADRGRPLWENTARLRTGRPPGTALCPQLPPVSRPERGLGELLGRRPGLARKMVARCKRAGPQPEPGQAGRSGGNAALKVKCLGRLPAAAAANVSTREGRARSAAERGRRRSRAKGKQARPPRPTAQATPGRGTARPLATGQSCGAPVVPVSLVLPSREEQQSGALSHCRHQLVFRQRKTTTTTRALRGQGGAGQAAGGASEGLSSPSASQDPRGLSPAALDYLCSLLRLWDLLPQSHGGLW